MRLSSIGYATMLLGMNFSAADFGSAGLSTPNLYPRDNHLLRWLTSEHFSVLPRNEQSQNILMRRSAPSNALQPRSPTGRKRGPNSRSPSSSPPPSGQQGQQGGSRPSPPSRVGQQGRRAGSAPPSLASPGSTQRAGGAQGAGSLPPQGSSPTTAEARKRKSFDESGSSTQGSGSQWGSKGPRILTTRPPGSTRRTPGESSDMPPPPPRTLTFTGKEPLPGTSELLTSASPQQMHGLRAIEALKSSGRPVKRPRLDTPGARPNTITTEASRQTSSGRPIGAKRPRIDTPSASPNTVTTEASGMPSSALSRGNNRPGLDASSTPPDKVTIRLGGQAPSSEPVRPKQPRLETPASGDASTKKPAGSRPPGAQGPAAQAAGPSGKQTGSVRPDTLMLTGGLPTRGQPFYTNPSGVGPQPRFTEQQIRDLFSGYPSAPLDLSIDRPPGVPRSPPLGGESPDRRKQQNYPFPSSGSGRRFSNEEIARLFPPEWHAKFENPNPSQGQPPAGQPAQPAPGSPSNGASSSDDEGAKGGGSGKRKRT